MPAPISAFAAICERIAGVDPSDVRAVDDFFLKDFAELDQAVRETAFNWALSLDHEPAEDDRDALDTLLAAVGFIPRRQALPDSAPADENRQCA
jgi:hypothetical protein